MRQAPITSDGYLLCCLRVDVGAEGIRFSVTV